MILPMLRLQPKDVLPIDLTVHRREPYALSTAKCNLGGVWLESKKSGPPVIEISRILLASGRADLTGRIDSRALNETRPFFNEMNDLVKKQVKPLALQILPAVTFFSAPINRRPNARRKNAGWSRGNF